MKRQRRFRDALLAAVLLSGCAAAQALTGQPMIQRFAPDLDVYPSSFAVAQDADGIVYVGGVDGLLSFDGSHWYAHTADYDDFVRSLTLDPDAGRLYVGGYDAFGYFETPLAPDADFVDLTGRLDPADAGFADVWAVLVAPEGVFFQALNHVFRYDPIGDTLETFRHPGRFGAIARIDDEVIVQYRGEGLRRWSGEAFEPMPGTEGLREQLFQLVPLPGGGALSFGRDGRWQRVDASGVLPFTVPEGLPASSEFNTAVPTPEGWIAMGNRFGDVWFLDPATGRSESVRVSTDWISGLAPSPEGGLVVQTDHETLHLRWPSRWTRLGPAEGLTGMIHEVLEWNGRWIAISNAGALALSADGAGFEPLDWTDFEAWDLQPLDDGTALFAESYVLKHVAADRVLRSFDEIQYPRIIVPSREEPGLYYVGTESGLAVLRREGSSWTVLKGNDERTRLIASLFELGAGDLLVGTDSDGLQRLRLDASKADYAEEILFGDEQISYGSYATAEVVAIDDQPHVVTMGGVWRYADGELVRRDLPGLDDLRGDSFLVVEQAPDGTLYAWDDRRLHRYRPPNLWQELDIAPLLRGAVGSLSHDVDGRLLIGMLGSLALHDPDAPESRHPGLASMLRSVKYRPADAPARYLDLAASPSLEPEGRFALHFEFTLAGLDGRDDIGYQARLVGFENAFTDWSSADHWTYYDLEPGRYAFEARARDALGRVTAIEPFEFEVVPPWYRTAWVEALKVLIVGLMLAFLVWLLMRARVWRLETERERLSTMVVERTEALEAANRQLKMLAEVDDLTGVANRRRLDAFLRQAVAESARRHRPIAVALIDLDRFKPFNDRHGHLAGDRALRQVAGALDRVFGAEDRLIARFGGDEFVAVMPSVDRDKAVGLAESARAALKRLGLDLKFSIGIAIAGIGSCPEPGELIDAADRQMYVAKKAGRDGIAVTTIERSSSGGAAP